MSEPRKSVEVEPWQATRLKCALGHRYAGRVRRVREEGHDMDGEAFLKSASHEYDPATCVVCGLQRGRETARRKMLNKNGTSAQAGDK